MILSIINFMSCVLQRWLHIRCDLTECLFGRITLVCFVDQPDLLSHHHSEKKPAGKKFQHIFSLLAMPESSDRLLQLSAVAKTFDVVKPRAAAVAKDTQKSGDDVLNTIQQNVWRFLEVRL